MPVSNKLYKIKSATKMLGLRLPTGSDVQVQGTNDDAQVSKL